MPFNDSATLILSEARRFLGETPVALEIFDQTLDVSDALIEHLLRSSHPFSKANLLKELLTLTPIERRAHVPLLYQALGFSEWTAIDSYPGRGNLVMDLNESLKRRYSFDPTFDLVSNKGSTEHIFDQRQAFENIHEACRTGGVMVHDVPTMNLFNHAFFGYHPIFFVELATANRYEILDLRLANRWGDTVPIRLSSETSAPVTNYRPILPASFPDLPSPLDLTDFTRKTVIADSSSPLSRAYLALSQRGEFRRPGNPGEIFVVAILRKVYDEPFRPPYQAKFISFIETDEFRTRYVHQMEKAPL